MAAKGRGGGKTPVRLVKMLNEVVSEKSVRSIARDTGLGLAPISRYLKGTSEPSQSSLEKLADYLKVRVAWLRGDSEDRTDADLEAWNSEAKRRSEYDQDAEINEGIWLSWLSAMETQAAYENWTPEEIDPVKKAIYSTEAKMLSVLMPKDGNYRIRFTRGEGINFTLLPAELPAETENIK